jgi:hypothetical protein
MPIARFFQIVRSPQPVQVITIGRAQVVFRCVWRPRRADACGTATGFVPAVRPPPAAFIDSWPQAGNTTQSNVTDYRVCPDPAPGLERLRRVRGQHNAQKPKNRASCGLCAQASHDRHDWVIVAAQAETIGSNRNTTCRGSIKLNGQTLFSRIVGFFRAGYSADAPQLGHVALIAMCPAAARVVRPSAENRNMLVTPRT